MDPELEVSEKLLEQELCQQKQAAAETQTCPSSTIQSREMLNNSVSRQLKTTQDFQLKKQLKSQQLKVVEPGNEAC